MSESQASKNLLTEAISKVEIKLKEYKINFEKNTNPKTQQKLMEIQFLLDLTKEQVQDENLNRSTR